MNVHKYIAAKVQQEGLAESRPERVACRVRVLSASQTELQADLHLSPKPILQHQVAVTNSENEAKSNHLGRESSMGLLVAAIGFINVLIQITGPESRRYSTMDIRS